MQSLGLNLAFGGTESEF